MGDGEVIFGRFRGRLLQGCCGHSGCFGLTQNPYAFQYFEVLSSANSSGVKG